MNLGFLFLFLFFSREREGKRPEFEWEKNSSKTLKKTGGFKEESDAARAYDVAVLACRGRHKALTNFPPEE